jgi:hypothetical protein
MSYLAESVENLMSETHELGGSAVVVDRATPKARICIAAHFMEELSENSRIVLH